MAKSFTGAEFLKALSEGSLTEAITKGAASKSKEAITKEGMAKPDANDPTAILFSENTSTGSYARIPVEMIEKVDHLTGGHKHPRVRLQLKVPPKENKLASAFAELLRNSSSAHPANPSESYVVEYMVHLANEGDTEFVVQPDWAGYQDHLYVQGVQLRQAHGSQRFGLRYKAHLGGTGDTGWYQQPAGTGVGGFCGTRGQYRQLQAIWIEVIGDAADSVDVFYSATLHETGETGWFRNGQMCGTIGQSRAMHALRIFLAERRGDGE